MTFDNNELINRLRTSIEKLKQMYANEYNARVQLEKINSELIEQLHKKDEVIEALEVKINTLKLAKTLSNTIDTNDARVKVINLVREIDKCIALLNR